MHVSADGTLVVDAVSSTTDDLATPSSLWRRRLATFGVLCIVWAIPGLVGGISFGVLSGGPDKPPLVSLSDALVWQLLAWIPWALWTSLAIWLVHRVPFQRGVWPRAVLLHLVVCACVSTIQILWAVALDRRFWPEPTELTVPEHIRVAFWRLADFEVMTYMAVVAIGISIDYFRRYREGQSAAERLRTEMVQAQLLALRSQLNPHFLFNALNSVITLMDRDVPAAQRMVARIGELLRLSLSADETEVPLEREMNLVRQYLEIERIRFGDRLTVSFDIPSELRAHMVPNLVLQPLVENAIVHGVAPRPGPGHVGVDARQENSELVLRVVDNGVGLARNGSRVGHGIGVGNTRARLTAIYGSDARLTLSEATGGGCIAEVRLPLMTV